MNRTKPARNSSSRKLATLLALALFACPILHAETCTTQSALDQPDRDGLADSARTYAELVQSNNTTLLKTISIAEVAKDFNGLQYLVASTAPKLAGGVIIVEQVYLLDATGLKRNADGSAPTRSSSAPSIAPPWKRSSPSQRCLPAMYGFAMVTIAPPPGATKPAPWRLSFLMRQEQGKWQLAGFYPKPLTAAGHDGLWYWTQARQFAAEKAALERVALLSGRAEHPPACRLRPQHAS